MLHAILEFRKKIKTPAHLSGHGIRGLFDRLRGRKVEGVLRTRGRVIEALDNGQVVALRRRGRGGR